MRLLTKVVKEEYFFDEEDKQKVVCNILTATYRIEFENEEEYTKFVEDKVSDSMTRNLKYENVGDLNNPIYKWIGTFVLIHKVTENDVEVLTGKR